MREGAVAAVLAVLVLVAGACGGRDSAVPAMNRSELEARATRFDSLAVDSTPVDTAHADTTRTGGGGDLGPPIARWMMPDILNELSGLGLTEDGRLLTHDDERGIIYEIDYREGIVLKQFLVGNHMLHEDFEGIAVAQGRLYLLSSNGELYEMREGDDGQHVPFTIRDTRLGRECEMEGLAYAPAIESLLLACKNTRGKKLDEAVVIYRWRLGAGVSHRLSRMRIPLDRFTGEDRDAFHPSGIEVDPSTGNYVIVDGVDELLAVVTPQGQVLRVRKLPREHRQTEGIAITGDGLLILSDEATKTPAMVTVYREW